MDNSEGSIIEGCFKETKLLTLDGAELDFYWQIWLASWEYSDRCSYFPSFLNFIVKKSLPETCSNCSDCIYSYSAFPVLVGMYVLLIFDLDQLTWTSFELEGTNGCNTLMGFLLVLNYFLACCWLDATYLSAMFNLLDLPCCADLVLDIDTTGIIYIERESNDYHT